mmetsp:Transcript_21558/g.59804  ORF Transcript_21558/g.59804 Transcript_21558/m.59804 type:complete len:213 (+) Transcript_21558:447-1085(+)
MRLSALQALQLRFLHRHVRLKFRLQAPGGCPRSSRRRTSQLSVLLRQGLRIYPLSICSPLHRARHFALELFDGIAPLLQLLLLFLKLGLLFLKLGNRCLISLLRITLQPLYEVDDVADRAMALGRRNQLPWEEQAVNVCGTQCEELHQGPGRTSFFEEFHCELPPECVRAAASLQLCVDPRHRDVHQTHQVVGKAEEQHPAVDGPSIELDIP